MALRLVGRSQSLGDLVRFACLRSPKVSDLPPYWQLRTWVSELDRL